MSFTIELIPFSKIKKDITVEVEICSDGSFTKFDWKISGEDAGDVMIPQQSHQPQRKNHLWEHTCFEVFQKLENGYDEFNVSPSHNWNSYHFDSYRSSPLKESSTEVTNIVTNESELMTSFQLELKDNSLLGLCCVLETKEEHYYFAIKHPLEKPDFHDPISFCYLLKR